MKVEFIGYFALALSLLALSMKQVLLLRTIHSLAAMCYLIYGYFIDASPIMLAGILSILIHSYHLVMFCRKKTTD